MEAKIEGDMAQGWRQKFKVLPSLTIIRRKKNLIDTIKNNDGNWITNKKEIREHVVEKFTQLYTEELVNFPSDLEKLISPIITTSENARLCLIPTPQEIKAIIFYLNSQKSPSPDGLPALFYKKYWSIVGTTIIVLIPKIKSPSTVNHFRPISLCNTIYKTISKLIVSRLRPILDKLISLAQFAFVPGRWISENQLIVHELLHSFKKRKVKGGFVTLKVDLQKAYDRVSWKFLQTVLTNFGFHEVFVNWIMECVSSVSFSVLINGGQSHYFFSLQEV